jgi:hypothetical protein
MAGPALNYSVTLHHLAPGATAAGVDYPDEQLTAVEIARLRELLHAFNRVAANLTLFEPARPEIRVQTDRDTFVVRARNGGLHFVGYETTLRGEEHTVAFIITTITGSAEHARTATPFPADSGSKSPAPPATRAAMMAGAESSRVPRWAKIAVMAAIIVICNGVTAWMLLRPVRTLAPKFTLLPPAESEALIAKYAGQFHTGEREGDRILVIEPGGTLQLARFGPRQTRVQPALKTVRGAVVDGRPALVTNDPAAITLKDADTLVFFGNTYRRR